MLGREREREKKKRGGVFFGFWMNDFGQSGKKEVGSITFAL
jgi:hypothetical protein